MWPSRLNHTTNGAPLNWISVPQFKTGGALRSNAMAMPLNLEMVYWLSRRIACPANVGSPFGPAAPNHAHLRRNSSTSSASDVAVVTCADVVGDAAVDASTVVSTVRDAVADVDALRDAATFEAFPEDAAVNPRGNDDPLISVTKKRKRILHWNCWIFLIVAKRELYNITVCHCFLRNSTVYHVVE